MTFSEWGRLFAQLALLAGMLAYELMVRTA
jgi:hypothetical protein